MYDIDLEEQKAYIAFVEAALDDWFKEICRSDAGFLKRVLDNVDNAMINDFIQKSKEYNTIGSVFNTLSTKYDMENWQFYLKYDNDVVHGNAMTIPITDFGLLMMEYENNVPIIEAELNAMGYVTVQESAMYNKETGSVAIWIIFSPMEEFPLNNYMYENMNKDGYKFLYHIAPNDIHTRISMYTYGFLPGSSENGILYKDRAFFKYWTAKEKEYFDMMRKRYIPDADGKIIKDIYSIRITEELLYNYKFYKDHNASECCFSTVAVDCDIDTPRDPINLNGQHLKLKE